MGGQSRISDGGVALACALPPLFVSLCASSCYVALAVCKVPAASVSGWLAVRRIGHVSPPQTIDDRQVYNSMRLTTTNTQAGGGGGGGPRWNKMLAVNGSDATSRLLNNL